MNPASLYTYEILPKHICVQVSGSRWQIAELSDELPTVGSYSPNYRLIGKKLTMSQAANSLMEFQRRGQ